MQLTTLTNAIVITTLLATMGLVSNSSGLPQATSSSQFKQAFGVQSWKRTIQAVNQINKDTEPTSNSKLALYHALGSRK
jgi:hypothetical protein